MVVYDREALACTISVWMILLDCDLYVELMHCKVLIDMQNVIGYVTFTSMVMLLTVM